MKIFLLLLLSRRAEEKDKIFMSDEIILFI